MVVLAAACTGSSGGAQPTPPKAGRSLHIVYAVEDRTSTPPRLTTQVLDLDRPYTARLVTRDGRPPGGKQLGGTIWERDHQYLIDASGGVQLLADTVPSFAGPDAHLDVALLAAERLGLVERAGTSTVADIACKQWTSRAPLDTGGFDRATKDESTVTCVDDHGRVLSEHWTLHGQLVRVRTAISVKEGPALDRERLFGGRTPRPLATPVSATQVQAEPADKLTTALGIDPIPAPPGFTLDRSVALIDVDSSSGTRQIVNEGAAFAWLRGEQLVTLVIRRGLRAPLPAPRDGAQVALGSNSTGRLSPVLSGLRIQFRTPAGLVLTATANLPEQALLSWLRRVAASG